MAHRHMKCPYCKSIFKISENQIINNTRFKCPVCRKYNNGSITATPDGILIGISKEDSKYIY